MGPQFYSITGAPDAEISFGKNGARVRNRSGKKSVFGRLTFWISRKTGWYQKRNRNTRRAYLTELNKRFQLGDSDSDSDIEIFASDTTSEKQGNAPLRIQDVTKTENAIRREQSKIELGKRIGEIRKERTVVHEEHQGIRDDMTKPYQQYRPLPPLYKWQPPMAQQMQPHWQEKDYMEGIQDIAGKKLQAMSTNGSLPPSKNEIEKLADDIAATSQTEAVNAILQDIAQKSRKNQIFHKRLIYRLAKDVSHEVTGNDIQPGGRKNEGDYYAVLNRITPNQEYEEELAKKILSLTEKLLQDPPAKVGEIYDRIDAEVEQFIVERSGPLLREFREIFQAKKNSSPDVLADIFQWVLNQQPAQEDCSVPGIGAACVALTEEIQGRGVSADKSAIINDCAEKLFEQFQWPSTKKATFMRDLAGAVCTVLNKEAMRKLAEELRRETPPERTAEAPSDFNPILDSVEEETSFFDQLPNAAQLLPSRQKSFAMELLEVWDANTVS